MHKRKKKEKKILYLECIYACVNKEKRKKKNTVDKTKVKGSTDQQPAAHRFDNTYLFFHSLI